MPNLDEYGNPAPQVNSQPAGGSDEQVRAAFLKYMGHPNTSNIWQNDPNWEQDIANSPEAKNYAASQSAPASGAPPVNPNAAAGTPEGAAAGNYTPVEIAAHALTGQSIGPKTYNREALSQAFQQKAFSGNANISLGDFLKSLEGSGIATGVTQISPDKIRLPDGEVVDVIANVGDNGQGNAWWGSYAENGGNGSNGNGAGGGPIGGGGGGSTPGTINGYGGNPTAYGPNGQQPTDPMGSAIQEAILKQLAGLQNPTDANSSTVHAITDPYHLQSQRGLEATRRALAEQAYASGNLGTGGYGQEQIKAVENAGANEAGFTGQTVATQEAQRQAMLMNILGLGQSASQFSQQLSATQKNFADQLAQQDKQFQQTLAQNIAQFGQTMGYQYSLLDWSKKQAALNHG